MSDLQANPSGPFRRALLRAERRRHFTCANEFGSIPSELLQQPQDQPSADGLPRVVAVLPRASVRRQGAALQRVRGNPVLQPPHRARKVGAREPHQPRPPARRTAGGRDPGLPALRGLKDRQRARGLPRPCGRARTLQGHPQPVPHLKRRHPRERTQQADRDAARRAAHAHQ